MNKKNNYTKYLTIFNTVAVIISLVAIALLFNGYLTQADHNMYSSDALSGKMRELEKRIDKIEDR